MKITYETLEKALNPYQMRNILGGSGDDGGGGDYCFVCWIGGNPFKGTGVDASNCESVAEALCDENDSFLCVPIYNDYCN